jgi:hypothetical protein
MKDFHLLKERNERDNWDTNENLGIVDEFSEENFQKLEM